VLLEALIKSTSVTGKQNPRKGSIEGQLSKQQLTQYCQLSFKMHPGTQPVIHLPRKNALIKFNFIETSDIDDSEAARPTALETVRRPAAGGGRRAAAMEVEGREGRPL